jgi:hypothetical protein
LPLYVFVAYGEVSAARDALERVKRMRGRRIQDSIVHPMLWRFDQLGRAPWREMALHDALRAHAIVLAMGRLAALDSTTDEWLAALTNLTGGAPITCTTFMGEEAWTISLQRREARAAAGVSETRQGAAMEMPGAGVGSSVSVRAA